MTTTFDIPMDEYVEWNATQNGEVKISKNSNDGTIVLGDPVAGRITYFTITLLPDETILESTAEYGTAVVYHHEARITVDTKEYLAIRGRMFIMPSQT
jgi:hypothetical protein